MNLSTRIEWHPLLVLGLVIAVGGFFVSGVLGDEQRARDKCAQDQMAALLSSSLDRQSFDATLQATAQAGCPAADRTRTPRFVGYGISVAGLAVMGLGFNARERVRAAAIEADPTLAAALAPRSQGQQMLRGVVMALGAAAVIVVVLIVVIAVTR